MDEAGDRGFGDAHENSHPGLPDGLWSKLWLDHEYELGKARKEREFAEREVGLLKDPSKAAELDISKRHSSTCSDRSGTSNETTGKLKECRKSISAQRKVMRATRAFAPMRDLKWEKALLDWIEQQYLVIASRRATSIHDTEGNNNQELAKKARSQSHPESCTIDPQS